MFEPNFLEDGPDSADTLVVLAHGAGSPMDHPFMVTISEQLGTYGPKVLRFEFPYMQMTRRDGERRLPDPKHLLLQHWKTVIEFLPKNRRIVIGGKSLGGRMASMIADESLVSGLICLGYPFHSPNKPKKTRVAHLETLQTPTIILQGERDPFGSYEEVKQYSMSPAINIHWLADGDHSFKPRKLSGRTETENLEESVRAISLFLKQIP